MSVRTLVPILGLFLLAGGLAAQTESKTAQISGNFQANANFFIRDSLIGAANTPQYDRQLYGGEG